MEDAVNIIEEEEIKENFKSTDKFKLHKNSSEQFRLDITPSKNVYRCLFSCDGKSENLILSQNFGINIVEKSHLWNFDFGKNIPMDNKNGLQWKEISLIEKLTLNED